jgi:hypothetical protein
MNNNILFENIKLKAELSFDILKESKEYKQLSSEIQSTMEECYNMGSEYGAALAITEGTLTENGDIDEGFFDRFKANISRAGQAVKNITGLGTQTTDSKDAAVNSLLASFQKKFEPLVNKPVETPQQANTPPKLAKAEDDGLTRIQQKVERDPTPAPSPAVAEKIVANTPNAPKGLKDKIIAGIRANPGKTKFLLGALAFGAGVAAAAMSGGNPVAAKIAGSLVNGIGNAALAKIQGRTGADAAMSGIGGAIAGAGLAGAGFNITNWLGSAAERAVDGLHNMLGGGVQSHFPASQKVINAPQSYNVADTSDVNSPEYQATQTQQNSGVADTSNTNSPAYQATQNQPISQTQAPVVPRQYPVGTRDARVAFDQQAQSKYFTSKGFTGAKDSLGRPISMFKEDDEEETSFEKVDGNVFKLKPTKKNKKSLKEARQLQPDAEAALNDFLDGLGKIFGIQGAGTSAGRKSVIAFMTSQGTRFKNVLDYLNKYQLLDGSVSSQGGAAAQQAGAYSNKNLAKYLSALKSSPFFIGNLQTRLIGLLKAKDNPNNPEDKASVATLKSFLSNLKNMTANASAQFRKKLGDPIALRKGIVGDPQFTTLREAAADLLKQNKDRQLFIQQFNKMLPNLIGATVELRNAFNKNNPNNIYGTSQTQPITEADGLETRGNKIQPNMQLVAADIRTTKLLLSRLIDLNIALQKINPAGTDKLSLKNIVLILLDIVV